MATDLVVRPLPLVKMVDGVEQQMIQVEWVSDIEADVKIEARLGGNRSTHRARAAKGDNNLRIAVPTVRSPHSLEVNLSEVLDNRILAQSNIELSPVRPWQLFLVHHSHLDIGYTDVQPHVMHLHMGFIDEAISFCEQTKDWDEGTRFKWTIEVTYPLIQYCRQRSPAQVRRLVECIRRGQIEVAALYANLHAETCSYEELTRSMYDAQRLSEEWDIDVVSAMQSDIPGQPWSLPQLLVDNGVKYLSLAPNNHRAPVHEDREFDRPFYWRTADGQRVLTWFTDDPVHVYQEGNTMGFIDSYKTVEERLPLKLAELEDLGYQFDALHMRCQGAYADNGPPNFKIAEIAKEWSQKWVWPQVRIATNREFFEYMEQHHSEQIPEYTGDWPDWWADGTGSAAREMSLVREARAKFHIAEAATAVMGVIGDAGGDEGDLAHYADREEIIREILLFDEHTWGAAAPEKEELRSFGSGGLQRSYKTAHAYRASDMAQVQYDSAIRALGSSVETTSYPTAMVFNALGKARSGVVEIEIPRDVGISESSHLVLRDTADGTELPYEWIPAGTHDRARVRFVVGEVPAFGYRKVELRQGGGQPAGSFKRRTISDVSYQLENKFYHIEIDPEKAGITSIIDKGSSQELVDNTAPYALNTYVYDHYVKDDERPINHRLILRHVPNKAEFVSRERTPIDTTLVYRVRGGEGADWVYSRVRLFDDLPWVELENVIEKQRVRHKEGAYFCFPFQKGERVQYDIPGGTCVLGEDQLPGGLTDWLVVDSGVWIEHKQQPIAWASVDAGLVHFGRIATIQPPRPAREENGHIFSYVLNNLWSTNFAPWQEGHLRFRYLIQGGAIHNESDFVYFGKAAVHPLVAEVLPPNQSGISLGSVGEFVRVQGAEIVVESIISAIKGGVLIRLREAAGRGGVVTVNMPLLDVTEAARTTPTEKIVESLPVNQEGITLEMKPREAVHLWIR